MAKVYMDGLPVSGTANYASNVNCLDKDGNESTVQAELDGLQENVSEVNKNMVNRIGFVSQTTLEMGVATTRDYDRYVYIACNNDNKPGGFRAHINSLEVAWHYWYRTDSNFVTSRLIFVPKNQSFKCSYHDEYQIDIALYEYV